MLVWCNSALSQTMTVTTFAGSTTAGSTDATGTSASFSSPQGVVVDASGNVYVADTNNNKIRKISSSGVVTTFAGSGLTGSTDGIGTAASFNRPMGLAIDASGNLFVADGTNCKIRKITSSGVVTTLAGSGSVGSADGTGTAASFYLPTGVAVDASGNVYVADMYNHKIRKITAAGVVTTLAGIGSSGDVDGAGTVAKFTMPTGVAVDASGNIYVADSGTYKIRKITPAGVVSTFAGTGSPGSADGTGTAASFNYPFGVVLDGSGNLYISDQYNHKVRKITSAGVVTTLAGTGSAGSVDGTGATASFNLNAGIAIDSNSALYLADKNNHKIRKIYVPEVLLYQFDFDNSYDDITNTHSFLNVGTFTTDRSGNINRALQLTNNGSQVLLPNLPIGNASRSVSIWFKMNGYLSDNFLFGYGSPAANLAYGFSLKSNLVNNYAWANDLTYATNIPLSTWKHLVVTFNSTTDLASIYLDGVLIASTSKPDWNTANDVNFYLGKSIQNGNSFNGSVDDLKIYNYPLTQTEITNLYNNNTLSTSDFNENNLKVAMYPNPVNDVLNIEIENEIKSVEIYNIQGQKVLQSSNKQIETNSLNSGIYMVRVEDVNGAVATQKLMKK